MKKTGGVCIARNGRPYAVGRMGLAAVMRGWWDVYQSRQGSRGAQKNGGACDGENLGAQGQLDACIDTEGM